MYFKFIANTTKKSKILLLLCLCIMVIISLKRYRNASEIYIMYNLDIFVDLLCKSRIKNSIILKIVLNNPKAVGDSK